MRVSAVRFFDDEGMDFAVRCVLSGVRDGMAEVGEVFTVCETIRDGDPDSWLCEFVALGRRLRAEADVAAVAGHRYSAWNAALRAANYLFAGLWWAPATAAAHTSTALWSEHRDAWDLAVTHWPTPAEHVTVPHGPDQLPGYWFRSRAPSGTSAHEDTQRSTVVLVQGLNTPMSDACMTGMNGALARGHHVLLFDGPGQGAALHRQGLTLRADWSPVIRDVLDWLAGRPEVDSDRIVVSGVNHGAYLALSGVTDPGDGDAAARVAVLMVDPGVVDLGVEARAAVAQAGSDPAALALLRGTTLDPTGAASMADALLMLDNCSIDAGRLATLRCPTLVVRSEDAASFPGQGATLLRSSPPGVAQELFLSHDEGAGADCGIDAPQIHDARVFDWLDDHLPPGRAR